MKVLVGHLGNITSFRKEVKDMMKELEICVENNMGAEKMAEFENLQKATEIMQSELREAEAENMALQKKLTAMQREKEDQQICVICFELERGVLLSPCGHYCLCKKCAPKVKECPICRTGIKKRRFVPVFL